MRRSGVASAHLAPAGTRTRPTKDVPTRCRAPLDGATRRAPATPRGRDRLRSASLTALVVTLAVLAVTGDRERLRRLLPAERQHHQAGRRRAARRRPPGEGRREGRGPRGREHPADGLGQAEAARTPINVEGERSDTTILLHLAADRESAVMVSIPRDTIVDIPSACARTAPRSPPDPRRCSTRPSPRAARPAPSDRREAHRHPHRPPRRHRLQRLQGHGQRPRRGQGLRPHRRQRPASPTSTCKAGTHTVKGQQALAYVRTRHGLGDGSDISRIDRQQAFLGSMVSKVRSTGLLLRPDRLLQLPRRGDQLAHHRPRAGQPQRAAQARPGREGHRHQGRHVRHRARTSPTPPTPTACSSSRRPTRCGTRCASTSRCPARSPRARRPRPRRSPARRWSRRPRTDQRPGPQRLRPRPARRAGSPRS